MMPCIYLIRNAVTSAVYVGSTVNFKQRSYAHCRMLAKGEHHSPKLQRAYNKYGKDVFFIEPVVYCDKANLAFYEQRFMDYFKENGNLYNVQPEAYTPRNSKLSEDHKLAISLGLKGKPKTKEHVEKVAKALVGRKGHKTPKTPEQREKIRQAVASSWARMSEEERRSRGQKCEEGRKRKRADRAVELVERVRTLSIRQEHVFK